MMMVGLLSIFLSTVCAQNQGNQLVYAQNQAPPKVFFQIKINGQIQPNPIVFELNWDTNPITSRNFLELSTMKNGYGYRHSKFHRIIDNFMCQGGDFTTGNGTGGYSIFNKQNFSDENINAHQFNQTGLLAMANSGKDTNGSQFFITTSEQLHYLDGHHVIFGKVIHGMDTVMNMSRQANALALNGEPLHEVEIFKCGTYPETGLDQTMSIGQSFLHKH